MKTVVGRALGEAGDSAEVPSPDTEPFGKGMPLNIDGKIGNGLLAGMSESFILPHLSTEQQEDEPGHLPSPELENDLDHVLAAAHAL